MPGPYCPLAENRQEWQRLHKHDLLKGAARILISDQIHSHVKSVQGCCAFIVAIMSSEFNRRAFMVQIQNHYQATQELLLL